MRRNLPLILAAALIAAMTLPARAVEYPHAEGAAIMADWVVLVFMVFFGYALVVFLIAVRRGYLSNLENAKYYLLSIEEADHYTPDWIKEAQSHDQRQ